MKLPHTQVHYAQSNGKDYCGVCKHYEPGNPPHCDLVKDPIRANGWCEKFKKVANPLYRTS